MGDRKATKTRRPFNLEIQAKLKGIFKLAFTLKKPCIVILICLFHCHSFLLLRCLLYIGFLNCAKS